MIPILTVFRRSPDGGRGLARDMRVRWALEEVDQPYEVRPVSFKELKEPQHRELQPFGQIPTYEEGELTLFETGAIVLLISQNHTGLLPDSPVGRARAIAWMFSALSTVEPQIVAREQAPYVERGQPWYGEERLAFLDDRVRTTLRDLSRRVADKEWLEGTFTAGDLLMIDVLRRLGGSPLLSEYPNLAAYVARGESRPAFERAFAAQRQWFEASSAE